MSRDVRAVAPRTGLIGLIVGIVLVVAGCDSGTGTSTPRTNRPDFGLGSGPSTTASTEAVVLAAYRGWWETFQELARNPDPDSPRLAEHATGQQLKKDRADLARFREQGRVVVGDVRLNPTVVDISSREAVVRDCVDGSRWVEVDKSSGSTIPNLHPAPDLFTVTLVRVKGTWKVADGEVRQNQC